MKFSKFLSYFLQLVFITLLLQSSLVQAKTTRQTQVRVQNLTGLEIESISVVHKYSDVFKDKHHWGKLPHGKITNKPMKIRYNTGAFTTGQDWWFITWKYKGNDSIQYTSPNNFRNFVDFVESIVLIPFDLSRAIIGNNPASVLADTLFNHESTVGFKKHLLRTDDQRNGVVITLTLNSVKFDSASGHSSTEGIKTRIFTADEKSKLPRANRRVVRKKQNDSRVQKVALKNSCFNSIQNKIAWNYKGSKQWNPANIKSLCGNTRSVEPAKCFNRIMHGGINWGGGTKWKYNNALNLCRQSQNASQTIACFRSENKQARGQWQKAINNCRA